MTQSNQEKLFKEPQDHSKTRLDSPEEKGLEAQPFPSNKIIFNMNQIWEDSKFLTKSAFMTSLTYLCNIITAVICSDTLDNMEMKQN